MRESSNSLTLDNFQTFGSLLKYLRHRARLTQRELSIAVGYSEAHVSRLEGSYRPPDAATLAALFVPALHLEDEPGTITRLLDLAAVARGEPIPEHVTITRTFGVEVTAEAVPLQGFTPHRHNLPLQLTSFVGRVREVEAVRQLLGHGARLVTLCGPGGCGKTRLALQVAESVVPERRDGVWLVELAGLSAPSEVDQVVTNALDQRAASGSLDALLVLDNCEHLIDACAEVVARRLRSMPTLLILATSREALRIGGETTYDVPALDLPERHATLAAKRLAGYAAVQLFVERARAVRSDFSLGDANATAVAQICLRLDGNPLAIELAAARVQALAVEQIAARLAERDRFGLLTTGSRAAPPRHQTLRAALDWSYALLSDAEQALLNRLSVFTTGCTLPAVESVCADVLDASRPQTQRQVEAPQVLTLLAQLVSKSFVMAREVDGEAHYRLLDTIREYAHEKLQDAGEATWLHSRYRWWRWRSRVRQQTSIHQSSHGGPQHG